MTTLLHADVTIDTEGNIYAPGGQRIGMLHEAVMIDSDKIPAPTYLHDVVKRGEIEQLLADYIVDEWIDDETDEYTLAHARQILRLIEEVRMRTDGND